MGTLFWILISVHVLVCFLLLLLVLIQNDKGGGLGGLAGGASANFSNGGGGSAPLIAKFTRNVAIGFMVIVMGINYFVSKQHDTRPESKIQKAASTQGLGGLLPTEGQPNIQTLPTAPPKVESAPKAETPKP
jgi:preprotein translocase subunit SecG